MCVVLRSPKEVGRQGAALHARDWHERYPGGHVTNAPDAGNIHAPAELVHLAPHADISTLCISSRSKFPLWRQHTLERRTAGWPLGQGLSGLRTCCAQCERGSCRCRGSSAEVDVCLGSRTGKSASDMRMAYLEAALLVQLHANVLQADAFGLWLAPSRHQHLCPASQAVLLSQCCA